MSQEMERAAAAPAPDEVPTPLATPALPRAKRVKEDPAVPAMAAEDWSSLHRKLPLLSEHYVVATTHSGYVVLVDKSPPHVASVLNPLTGIVVRFAVAVPPEVGAAHVVSHGCSVRTLVLQCNSSRTHYLAGSNSQVFTVHMAAPDYDFLLKAAVGGGVYAYLNPYVDGVLPVIYNFLGTNRFDPLKFFSGHANYDRGFLVGLAGHMLLVFKPRGIHYPYVLRFDTATRQLVPVQRIIKFAIFVGHQRCLAVDSDKFPGVEENCVYYTQHLGSSAFIYKCNITDKKVERISESDDFVRQDKQFVLVADRPFTIIHILSSYTINIPDSQLALQQMP